MHMMCLTAPATLLVLHAPVREQTARIYQHTAGIGIANMTIVDVDASTQALTLTFTGGALAPLTIQLPKAGSTTTGAAPLPAPATVVYYAAAWSNGQMGPYHVYKGKIGGRVGADARCRASTTKPTGYAYQYRAVLSFDATDTIGSMPGNFGLDVNKPVRWHIDDVLINTSWANFLAGATEPGATKLADAFFSVPTSNIM